MSFDVPADAYDRFMGRYSGPLSTLFADLAGATAGQRLLDVGCGPGALTAELARRGCVVSAADPSPAFVAASRARFPGVEIALAPAEELPFDDGSFDAALAQLVVPFMADPGAGLRQMARVVRPGGVVAACVWDNGGDRGPLSTFWRAVRDVDRDAESEVGQAGVHEGDLQRLMVDAGLAVAAATELTVSVRHADVDAWWHPFTLGVGPAGRYLDLLDDTRRARLRDRCAELLPPGGFTVVATAWAVSAVAG